MCWRNARQGNSAPRRYSPPIRRILHLPDRLQRTANSQYIFPAHSRNGGARGVMDWPCPPFPSGGTVIKFAEGVGEASLLQPFNRCAVIGVVEVPGDNCRQRRSQACTKLLHLSQPFLAGEKVSPNC